jgi:hypothetical protein
MDVKCGQKKRDGIEEFNAVSLTSDLDLGP